MQLRTNETAGHSPPLSPPGVRAADIRLDQTQLALRWRLSPRTLERWRWRGQGPCYLKVGARVLYRLEDIETYEALQRRESVR